jgi:putative transcriptional regulator
MNNLHNKFLVAAPKLNDPRFMESVIFMYKHNVEGAIGFISNKPVSRSLWLELCKKAEIKNPVQKNVPIYFGGPVESQVGFVLHTTDYKTMLTEEVNSWLSVTQGVDILVDIAQGSGPRQFQITLGYAGWNPGQLELEIESSWPRDSSSGWMYIDATEELLFGTDDQNKWEKAIGSYATDTVDKLLDF